MLITVVSGAFHKDDVNMGFISEQERSLLNEIYSYNPILFDFVLKRTIKSPGSGNKLMRDAFVFPDSI